MKTSTLPQSEIWNLNICIFVFPGTTALDLVGPLAIFWGSSEHLGATFRGNKIVVRAGDTINIPSNAPQQFHNSSSKPVRMLCLCSPAGNENFLMQVGTPVETRTTPPPKLDRAAQERMEAKAKELAPRFRTELLRGS